MGAAHRHGEVGLRALLEAWGPADAQSVPWSPETWLALPAEASPGRSRLAASEVLHRLADVAPEQIRRTDVTAVAESPTDLLIASMAWGFGPLGYGAHRTGEMLDTADVDGLAEDIVRTVREEGAGPGFTALFKPNGRGQIYGLGIAMGTKLLYFACRDARQAQRPRPLIYDQWVYAGLHALPTQEQPRLSKGGRTLPSPKGWVTTVAYEHWCSWAAERARDRPDTLPEDLEYALFAEANPRLSRPMPGAA